MPCKAIQCRAEKGRPGLGNGKQIYFFFFFFFFLSHKSVFFLILHTFSQTITYNFSVIFGCSNVCSGQNKDLNFKFVF